MAANKFSFMDILNAQSKADTKAAAVTEYTEIYLNPYDVEETESNFYSQESIEELAGRRYTCCRTATAAADTKRRRLYGHTRRLRRRATIYLKSGAAAESEEY